MKQILFIMVAFLFVSNTVNADENLQAPIVLELFTSQSCSSCPPADKILKDLASKNDNIIALSCHVTYWNHLNWKDTLSQESCTDRQRGYVISLDSRGPYTPQIVINGQTEMVGSREVQIKEAIDNIKTPLQIIDLSQDNENLNIVLPAMPKEQYIVTLISYGQEHTENIHTGENRGKIVEYTNPVTKIEPLSPWDGAKGTMELNNSELQGDKKIVVLVHKGSPRGPIVAAGKINL